MCIALPPLPPEEAWEGQRTGETQNGQAIPVLGVLLLNDNSGFTDYSQLDWERID